MTMRTMFLALLLTLTACGGEDLAPSLPSRPHVGVTPDLGPAQLPVPAPDLAPAGAWPARLVLPARSALALDGTRVPLGPLTDTVLRRACHLSAQGLCVPVDTTALPAKATAGYLSDRCQGPLYLALTLDQARGRDLFDGERVYVVKTATGAISASTLMGSARDSNGACYQTTVKAPTGSDFWFEVASVEKAGAVFASVL